MAEQTPEAYIPAQVDLDLDILNVEVARLPERLRVSDRAVLLARANLS